MFTDIVILVSIMLFFVVLLAILVSWHAKKYAFVCPTCSLKFTLTPFKDLVSLNGLDQKYAKCPNCGQRHWAQMIKR